MSAEAVDGSGLLLRFARAPWDEAVCGYPVVQIETMRLRDGSAAEDDYQRFADWCAQRGVGLVSCRLAHDALAESMFLEERGFRFVEMVISPEARLERLPTREGGDVDIAPACAADLPEIEDIAGRAFTTDRFSVDFRLARSCAGERFRRWVRSTLDHPRQRLLKASVGGRIAAFFVIENQLPEGRSYWHLHAVAPHLQGQGLGTRIWRAMVEHCRSAGLTSIRTTVSLRNPPVLNLYAGLGFRFGTPQMTFHWVRDDGN